MLEEVMTLDRLEIATTLDKIFLGQGMILPFLDVLIQQDLQQTSKLSQNCLHSVKNLPKTHFILLVQINAK